MLKKIAIITLVFIIAILVFLFIQLHRLQNSLEQTLNQYHITTTKTEIHLLPRPTIIFNQVQHQQFSADNINAIFSLNALISDHHNIALQLENFKLANNDNPVNLKLNIDNFNLVSINELRVDYIKLNGSFNKPLYANNKDIEIEIFNGKFSLDQENNYNLMADNLIINQQPIGKVKSSLDLNLNRFITAFNNGQLIYQQIKPNFSELILTANKLPIEYLLTMLKYPNVIVGESDINIQLLFNASIIEQGEVKIYAQNGKIIGLDLLDIASRYLPINYNKQDLAKKNLSTQYKEFYSEFNLNYSQIELEKIFLINNIFLAQGKGNINLENMQCNITVELKANHPKYSALILPIEFFDHCSSPQYKIKLNKDFRHQLKNFILDKFR